MDKQVHQLVSAIVPAITLVAESHAIWEQWKPPTDHRLHKAYRSQVQDRLTVLGRLVHTAVHAKKDANEVRTEIAVLKYCLSLLRPLSQQLAAARARVTTTEKNLSDTRARIRLLEVQEQELEETLDDCKTSVAEIQERINEELADLHAPSEARMDQDQPPRQQPEAPQDVAHQYQQMLAQQQLQQQAMAQQLQQMQMFFHSNGLQWPPQAAPVEQHAPPGPAPTAPAAPAAPLQAALAAPPGPPPAAAVAGLAPAASGQPAGYAVGPPPPQAPTAPQVSAGTAAAGEPTPTQMWGPGGVASQERRALLSQPPPVQWINPAHFAPTQVALGSQEQEAFPYQGPPLTGAAGPQPHHLAQQAAQVAASAKGGKGKAAPGSVYGEEQAPPKTEV